MAGANNTTEVERDVKKIDFTGGSDDVSKYRYYPDNPTTENVKKEFVVKEASKFYDPCQETAKMSMRCLERANFDRTEARTLCWDYFKAYRECKKEWLTERKKNRAEGKPW